VRSQCDRYSHSPCRPPRAGLCEWQQKRVVKLIDARLHGPIRVAELASVVGLSKGHFSRAFGITFGTSPHAYVMSARIRHAQLLMRATDTDIGEVAAACGLSDHAHLTRLFRRLVGITPSTWRMSAANH
jgi:AraC-like DNA-binding protein